MGNFGDRFRNQRRVNVPNPRGNGEIIRITREDIENQQALAQRAPADQVGQQIVEFDHRRYQVEPLSQGESEYFGIARNVQMRSEQEPYFSVFDAHERTRHHQILNFNIERHDREGNIVDYIPVEIRAQLISGSLPTEGVEVLIHGRRSNDGVIRTFKVWNIQTGSGLTIRKQENCFIATAAYDRLDDPAVNYLRGFRDQYLMKHELGRTFVEGYYQISPPLANYIKTHSQIQRLVKDVLDQLIAILIRHYPVHPRGE